ncbi:uncharacterized protein BDZ99DRAFT_312505 [Mytilinidion resinicola]|uniref:Wax synthase domain-containing protein n=1 Tax=Mytilinidion resinicola TaxID=574789 RepID=A0A6A6YNZ0_9PEZI|nr:uncharacterized protein BDZ99DRAFT_312505 [Mytilinidion resinicola]KAF2810461.1 hypothetical protein BDZ99DRAFT_312505 [Mytilinidion resinicola]
MESSAFLQDNCVKLFFLVVVGALAFQPSLIRTATTLPLLGILLWQFVLVEEKGFFGDHFSLGCLIGLLSFAYIDRIVLANPDKEGWHKLTDSDAESRSATPAAPVGSFRRLWWSLLIFFNLRGVGWSYQVKNVPTAHPADYSRWKFVLRKLFLGATFFIIEDTLCSWTASTPWGSFRDVDGFVPVGFQDSVSYQTRFLLSWTYILITYYTLEFINCVISVVLVTLHFANPSECPPLFGDPREMYTLRKAWSVTWHQSMRRACATMGLFAARDVLRLKKGTFASKYVQLFVGFGVSATIHAMGSVGCYGALQTNGEFTFFMAQALAIMIEDHVVALGRKLGARDRLAWRVLGYVWVTLWFGLNSAWFSAAIVNGIWNHQRGADVFGLGPPRPVKSA